MIVCIDERERQRIVDTWNDMEKRHNSHLHLPFPITYKEFHNNDFSIRLYHNAIQNGILVDNAELLLQTLTRFQIKAITLSTDNGKH